MSNQNQQAIHALKTAVSSENIKHHDNNYIPLRDIRGALDYIILTSDKADFEIAENVNSILNIVNKEVANLQDELKRHYDDTNIIFEPQNKEVESA